MERIIDDSVKQKLLDSLAEEPTMVLSTAYVYAKNYVEYGEDITRAWTTAVQQTSILELFIWIMIQNLLNGLLCI